MANLSTCNYDEIKTIKQAFQHVLTEIKFYANIEKLNITELNPLQPNFVCLEKIFFYCFFFLYRPSGDAKISFMIFFSKIVDFVERRPYGLIGHQKCIFGKIRNIG